MTEHFPTPEPEKNLEQIMVEKTIEQIEQNPNVNFIVDANGSLYGDTPDKIGQHHYYFDKEKHEMVHASLSDFNSLELELSDKIIPFSPSWRLFKDKKENNYYGVSFPFNPQSANSYTAEHRGGTHLSLALCVHWDTETLNSFGEEKIKEHLKNPYTSEAKKFFTEVLSACAEKYIPEYWNFYKNQLLIYKSRNT